MIHPPAAYAGLRTLRRAEHAVQRVLRISSRFSLCIRQLFNPSSLFFTNLLVKRSKDV